METAIAVAAILFGIIGIIGSIVPVKLVSSRGFYYIGELQA